MGRVVLLVRVLACVLACAPGGAPADADLRPERVEANLERGPAGLLRLRALARDPDPRVREAAAQALGDRRALRLGAAASRQTLMQLLSDVDGGVRLAAVRALLLGHGPEKVPGWKPGPKAGARWRHHGLASLRRVLRSDPALSLRLRPAIEEVVAAYTRAMLHRLVDEHNSIYYQEMFERIGLFGEEWAAEPLLRILMQPNVAEHTTGMRKRLIDLSAKALGDLGYRSALPTLEGMYRRFKQQFGDDDSAVESLEVSIHRLLTPRERPGRSMASARLRRLERLSRWSTYYGRQLAYYQLRLGMYRDAIGTYKSLMSRMGVEDAGMHYNIACAYSKLGDTNNGLDHLERALRGGYDDLESISQDRDLDFLRRSPRYAALIARFRRK